jgi:hypothetical protein
LTSLVSKIEERLEAAAGKTPRPPGVYVLFDNKSDALPSQLQSMAECESLKRVFLCIGAAPQDYEVSGAADVTVVIYNPARRGQQRVTANFALRLADLDDRKTDAIVKALSDVLPR